MSLPKILTRETNPAMPPVVWSAQRQARTQAVSLLSRIGNTPLLDLSAVAHSRGVNPAVSVFAKAEWFNPGGSVKARPALRIVEDAEKRGELTPDKILIDSSSGNTGIAFALIGSAKGYRVQLVMPANVSAERKALVRAYGAELIETDPLEGADGAILTVREMVAKAPERFYYANQYNNPSNWQAHFTTTGPEIWTQTGGRITHFVAGMGTTGTFTGTGRYLKQRKPTIELVGIQPVDEFSVIEGLKHLETAIVPTIFDAELPDRYLRVGPETAWSTTRQMGREAGLFIGLSAGAAVSAAIEVAQEVDEGVVVTVLPDDGSKYVSLGVFD